MILYNFFTGQVASVLGIQLGRSIGDLEPKTYDLSLVDGKDSSGVFYKIDGSGNLFRLGLYLTRYRNRLWKKDPSLHIDFCDNVVKAKHLMRATNTQVVSYFSTDDEVTLRNQRLRMCQKCLRLLNDRMSIKITGDTFSEFVLSLEENDSTKCKDVGYDGYVANWQQISRSFRDFKNYKCEYCGFHLKDMRFTKFIHVHHMNAYDKLDNRRSNLKCLCVKCHSEVDSYHKTQFSSIENQLLLAEFDEFRSLQNGK